MRQWLQGASKNCLSASDSTCISRLAVLSPADPRFQARAAQAPEIVGQGLKFCGKFGYKCHFSCEKAREQYFRGVQERVAATLSAASSF